MKDNIIRIIVVNVEDVMCAEVYDEIIVPVEEAETFSKKYTDLSKYRLITV